MRHKPFSQIQRIWFDGNRKTLSCALVMNQACMNKDVLTVTFTFTESGVGEKGDEELASYLDLVFLRLIKNLMPFVMPTWAETEINDDCPPYPVQHLAAGSVRV